MYSMPPLLFQSGLSTRCSLTVCGSADFSRISRIARQVKFIVINARAANLDFVFFPPRQRLLGLSSPFRPLDV